MKTLFRVLFLAFFAFSVPTITEAAPPEPDQDLPAYETVTLPSQPIVDSVLTPQPQNELQYASMNPIDYGLVGTMALGILGLLTYMVKSDRADKKNDREDRLKLIEAIDNLRSSVEAQKASNDRLSTEIHSLVKEFEFRLESMEDSVKRIEDKIGK